ncbi:MAG: ABC transporter permease subunit [Holophagaceae bacterium]|nr:ABC transporter permease subunit [Holophagaceae bacterium]
MIKKIATSFLLTLLTASLFTACASKNKWASASGLNDYTDFINSGKIIAVQSGENFNVVARDLFKAKEVPEYSTMPDLLEALRMNKIDAVMTDGSYVKQLVDSGMFPEYDYLWIAKDFYVNESAPVFYKEELLDKYNKWLVGIKADGTIDEITNRWIGVSLPEQKDVPKINLTKKNGTLRVCDTGNYPPFAYFDSNGKPTGFDYELISRFAQHLEMDLDITLMAYDAIIPYVISGRADMSACLYTVTAERGKSVLLGSPTIVTQGVLIVPKGVQTSHDYTNFKGQNIAVITGSLCYNTSEKIGAKPVNYNDSSSAAEDVRKGRVAGYMHALTAVQVMAGQLDEFEAVAVPKEIFSAQIGGISYDQSIIDRFNAFLSTVKTNGTLEEMQRRWFSNTPNLEAPLPKIQNSGKNGILKVAICSDSIPYVYVGANGEYSGFSVELIQRFGAFESKTVEYVDMEFGGLIPYIVSKKCNLAIANMAITDERKKSVLFTDPFFDEQHGILALKKGGIAVANADSVLNYSDFAQKKIGVSTGTIGDKVAEDIGGIPAYYSETSAGVEDVRKGRISGYMVDLSAARILTETQGNEDLQTVEVPAEFFVGPMGALSVNKSIISRFNVLLANLKANGTLAEMQERWLKNVPDLNSPMPEIPSNGNNGTLKVATTGTEIPFAYIGANGTPKGYSVELAMRFAAQEGMKLEFADMEFGGLIPYVLSGRADLAIANVSITEERKKSVLFSDSIYDDQLGIITLKSSAGNSVKTGGFIKWVKIGIERNLITDSRWKLILNGLGATMLIAISAQVFGTIFGFLVCFMLLRSNRLVKWLANLYCGLVHGTPIVVLLMVTYYIILGNAQISGVLVAIVAFTFIVASGIAINLKGAIETVDPVEIEAARSIGFSAMRAFLVVTLPQATRRALPGYTNGFVELVKATAIVGYIAIQDLTRAGDIIRSRTYDAYFPLLFVALIYLIVTTVCVQLFKIAVRKVNGGISQ